MPLSISGYGEDGILQDKGVVVSTDKEGEGRGTYHTLFFDAHSTGALIPLLTDFWCDNARMEVGLMVKGIYLGLYPGMMGNVAADEVPARILLSETADAVIAGSQGADSSELRPLFDQTLSG